MKHSNNIILIVETFQEGVSLIYEGILPGNTAPKFTNLVTMVHPNDNMVLQKLNLKMPTGSNNQLQNYESEFSQVLSVLFVYLFVFSLKTI